MTTSQVETESFYCQKCKDFFHYSQECNCKKRDSWLPEEPKIRIKWIYGNPDPPVLHGRRLDSLRNLATHRITGERFSAKSTLLGTLEYKMVVEDSTGYDFYSAKSNEALSQLECRKLKNRIVLIHDDSVRLKCAYETMPMSKLDASRTPEGKLYITVGAFYPSDQAKYAALLKFTRSLESRADGGWNHVDVLAIREAQEYINSKTLTGQSRTQKEANEDFINFHNSAYHFGMSVILDSQRAVEVAKNIRELNTFTYYKSYGAMEIPSSLYWIGSQYYANFDLDDLRSLAPHQFLIITNRNSVGIGSFDLPYWYYHRGEGLLKKYDITVLSSEGKEIDTKTRAENEEKARQQGHAGRKKITSEEMREKIVSMMDEGKSVKEIYIQLINEGYKGSPRTIRNEFDEIQRRRLA